MDDPGAIVSVRLEGAFTSVLVRSVPPQDPPYRPYAEVCLTDEVRWVHQPFYGVFVGFRFPDLRSLLPGRLLLGRRGRRLPLGTALVADQPLHDLGREQAGAQHRADADDSREPDVGAERGWGAAGAVRALLTLVPARTSPGIDASSPG